MYYGKVLLRHTVADAAGSAVWAMHNPAASTGNIFLREIFLRLGFDGTAAATSSIGYELWRFTTADPTTGTTVPRIKRKSAYSNSFIADANIQQKSGILTMTSVVYDADAFSALLIPASATAISDWLLLQFPFNDIVNGETSFVFAPNEGLAIRIATGFAAIIGQSLSGHVAWSERAVNR